MSQLKLFYFFQSLFVSVNLFIYLFICLNYVVFIFALNLCPVTVFVYSCISCLIIKNNVCVVYYISQIV